MADLVKVGWIKQACFQTGKKGFKPVCHSYYLVWFLCFGVSDAAAIAGSTLPDSCCGIAATAALGFDEKSSTGLCARCLLGQFGRPLCFRIRICVADFENAIDLLRNEKPMYLIWSGPNSENGIKTTVETVEQETEHKFSHFFFFLF